MTKRFRRRLFYSLFLIFLITGAGLVAYSHGWRIDLANFTIQKTGGIYILIFLVFVIKFTKLKLRGIFRREALGGTASLVSEC